MYAQLDKKSEEHLDGLVKKALGEGWQDKTCKVLKDALDAVTYDVMDYISAELQGHLQDNIGDAARHAAQNFLDALAEGKEEQVAQFLMLPNDYWKQRERFSWLDYGREHGPIALRRKMLEAVRDRLEREVILDQEAQIKALAEKCQKQEDELYRWRTGELAR